MTQTSGGEKGKPKTLEELVNSMLGRYEDMAVDHWMPEIARNVAKATIAHILDVPFSVERSAYADAKERAKEWLGSESGK